MRFIFFSHYLAIQITYEFNFKNSTFIKFFNLIYPIVDTIYLEITFLRESLY